MGKKLLLLIVSIALITLGFFVSTSYIEKLNAIKQYAFSMDSIDGKVSLSDFKGKYKLIYFGYMYCPDICPTCWLIYSLCLTMASQK